MPLNLKFADFNGDPVSSTAQGIITQRGVDTALGLGVTSSPTFSGLTITDNLSVRGTLTYLNTNTTTTSALSVVNNGTQTALLVNQTGAAGIVDFQDNGTSAFFINDSGRVGIGTITPNEKLTVNGNISSNGNVYTDSIQFDLNAGITTPAQGQIAWDAEDETLHYTLDTDTTARIGQDQYMRVKVNQAVLKGQALYASGTSGGGSGNIQASLYNAVSGGVDELYFIGLAAADMAINEFGFAITFGKLKGVSLTNTRETGDSSSWPAGTVLYVSAKQAGFLTSVAPTAPNRDIPVAFVISESGGTRGIFVRYEHGYHLDELHDVKYIQPILDGDLLTWNNSLSVWTNEPNTEPIFTTWSQTNSANYQSTYTTVRSNSATWNGGTLTYQRWSFLGTGTQRTFSIPGMVEDDSEGYRVYVDNVFVDPIEYTVYVNTNTIVFNTPPMNNTDILVIGQYATQIITISATGDFIQDFDYTTTGQLTGKSPSGTITRTNPVLVSTNTTLKTASGKWDSTYTSFNTNSAKYDSTYTSVNTNSAKWDSTYTTVSSISANLSLGQIGLTIDGGGSVITSGAKRNIRIPYNCRITSYELVGDTFGDITINIYKSTYATYPPTSNSITGGNPPTLNNQLQNRDTTLTGWTPTLTAGDYLGFNASGIEFLTEVDLVLTVVKQ